MPTNSQWYYIAFPHFIPCLLSEPFFTLPIYHTQHNDTFKNNP